MRDDEIICDAIDAALLVDKNRNYLRKDDLRELDSIVESIAMCPTYEGLVRLSQTYLDKSSRLKMRLS